LSGRIFLELWREPSLKCGVDGSRGQCGHGLSWQGLTRLSKFPESLDQPSTVLLRCRFPSVPWAANICQWLMTIRLYGKNSGPRSFSQLARALVISSATKARAKEAVLGIIPWIGRGTKAAAILYSVRYMLRSGNALESQWQ